MRHPWTFILPVAFGVIGAAQPAVAGWISTGVPVCASGCDGQNHRLARDAAGGAYVAWSPVSFVDPSTGEDIYLQRITASGVVPAGWPLEGLAVCAQTQDQYDEFIVEDGTGGALLGWNDRRDLNLNRTDIYGQRMLAGGTVSPGWAVGGVGINRDPKSAAFVRVAPDGAGGAFFAWQDFRAFGGAGRPMLYAQHILPDGNVAPGWPLNGRLMVSDSTAIAFHALIADGAGGFFTTWTTLAEPPVTRALRVTGAGDPAPGWPASGVLINGQFSTLQIVGDGAGGLYLPGSSAYLPFGGQLEYRIHHLTALGVIAPGWSASGLVVRTGSEPAGGEFASSDGAGGVVMAWHDYRDGFGSHIYAARVLPSGMLAPGWTPNGLLVSDPANGSDIGPKLAPDQTGGMYVTWQTHVGTYNRGVIQHVTASGSSAPGWAAHGQPLLQSGYQNSVQVISDDVGGAIVAWAEDNPPTRFGIFLQHYSPNGIVAVQLSLASATANPNAVSLLWSGAGASSLVTHVERRTEGSEWQTLGPAQADGPDRLRYQDATVAAGIRYAYRLGYNEDGAQRFTGETWVDVPLAFQLALDGFWPNPATGPLSVSFSLPSAAHASIDLIDVSGRRVAQRDLSGLGAGRHLVRLAESGMAPGVYWIRLQQGEKTLLKRGVVTR